MKKPRLVFEIERESEAAGIYIRVFKSIKLKNVFPHIFRDDFHYRDNRVYDLVCKEYYKDKNIPDSVSFCSEFNPEFVLINNSFIIFGIGEEGIFGEKYYSYRNRVMDMDILKAVLSSLAYVFEKESNGLALCKITDTSVQVFEI